MTAHLRRWLHRLLLPVLSAATWQLLAIWLNRATVLPRLDSVAAVLLHPGNRILATGSLWENMAVSLLRVLLGFLTAAAVAVPLGLAMGYARGIYRIFDVMIEMLRPIPPLAWVPLILAWMGIKGLADWVPSLGTSMIWSNIQFSTLTIIFIGTFFPILLNTIQGVRRIPCEYVESAKTLGSRGLHLWFRVLIPASLPMILTGLRIGLGIGWMCLVAAEMMPGSSSGLGYLIWHAYELLRTDIIVAGMVTIGLIGFGMDRAFRCLENHIVWKNSI